MHEKYKTLQELTIGIKTGEIDEAKVRIILDNDNTCVELMGVGDENPPALYRGNGYCDIEDLWPLLFPKAQVEWC